MAVMGPFFSGRFRPHLPSFFRSSQSLDYFLDLASLSLLLYCTYRLQNKCTLLFVNLDIGEISYAAKLGGMQVLESRDHAIPSDNTMGIAT